MSKIECCYDYPPSYQDGHTHSFGHLIIPLSNKLYLRIEDQDIWLNCNQLAVVVPEAFHCLICTEKLIWFNVPQEMFTSIDMHRYLNQSVNPINETLQPLIILIKNEVRQNPKGKELLHLFYYLFAKLTYQQKSLSILYIGSNYGENLSIPMLAEMEGYNPKYYISWFKSIYGVTPNEYIINLRMEKAKQLLTDTDYSVTDIALLVGYQDTSSFSRIFKQIVGLSPINFRKNCKTYQGF